MRYNAAREAKGYHANRDSAREVDVRRGRYGGRRANRARRLRDGAGAFTRRNPPELGNLAELRDLYLGDNQLSGGIPPELGGLENLETIDLENNRLSGGIPPEIGGLAELRKFDLSQNHLSGEIPPEIGGLVNLKSLYIRDNQLTGCIPDALRGVNHNDFGETDLPFCQP